MKPAHVEPRKKGGRPPKFKEPRRPITVTLPERTLEQLSVIDKDRAKAIVRAATSLSPTADTRHSSVEVVEVLPGVGIILIGRSRYLKHIPWLRLVEVAQNRHLLVLPTDTGPDSLEIALVDLYDSIPESDAAERKLVKDLQVLMRTIRHGRKVTKAEILFVNTSH